jgi:hypothetical protein
MTRGRKKITTEKAIRESGATINPNNIYYDSTKNRAYVKVPDGTRAYISEKKAGGLAEMFYAAAGLRNYISKYKKKPSKSVKNQILTRAKNAEKSKYIWEKRYEQKTKNPKNQFKKESPELIASRDDISIEVPSLLDIGTDTKTKKSRRIGKQRKTIESKTFKLINSLGLDINSYGLTYRELTQDIFVVCKPDIDKDPIRKTVSIKKAGSVENAFKVADKVREYIKEYGTKPSKEIMNDYFRAIAQKEQSPKNQRPIPSEVNPPNAQREQIAKSKETTGIFSKIKMWLFG